MRRALGLLCCLCLAGADVARLSRNEQGKRFFDLRRELRLAGGVAPESGGGEAETLYYRATVAARFGQEAMAIGQLRRFLATGPDRTMERKAHQELASALARAGSYGDAASEWAAALRLTPMDDPGRALSEDTQGLYEALRDVPPQTVEFEKAVPVRARLNRLGAWLVPVNVNGKKMEWVFDTGAGISIVTESEAAKIGLPVRPAQAYFNGFHYSNGSTNSSSATGKRIPLRVAVAADLRFGAAHLRNIAIAVIGDDAFPKEARFSGTLGLAAIRALGGVGISAKGLVRLGSDSTAAPGSVAGEPNLFFDELAPVVEVYHGGRSLQLMLDTGSPGGSLYPSFRPALNDEERALLRKDTVALSGAPDTAERIAEIAPQLWLQLDAKGVAMANVPLLPQPPAGSFRYEDGVIGMDALASGFMLDFKAMQLRLD